MPEDQVREDKEKPRKEILVLEETFSLYQEMTRQVPKYHFTRTKNSLTAKSQLREGNSYSLFVTNLGYGIKTPRFLNYDSKKRLIRDVSSYVPILVVTQSERLSDIEAAVLAGAKGFLKREGIKGDEQVIFWNLFSKVVRELVEGNGKSNTLDEYMARERRVESNKK